MPLYNQPTEGLWTPVLTFATPGDLAVTYTEQLGRYVKVGNWVDLTFSIVTSAFTYTTATGALNITGLPFASKNDSINYYGAMIWAGITKAGYTEIAPLIAPNTSLVRFAASGSGVAISSVVNTDALTTSAMILRGTLGYRSA